MHGQQNIKKKSAYCCILLDFFNLGRCNFERVDSFTYFGSLATGDIKCLEGNHKPPYSR